MKIYEAGYTRKGSLKVFDNLPMEYQYLLKELQLEKMSESIEEGFVWKVHTNHMYSLTSIQSIMDKEIDARKIPLIASWVMDQDAARFLMERPERLVAAAVQLKKTGYQEIIHFHQREEKTRWEQIPEYCMIQADSERTVVDLIVQATRKLHEEKEPFAGFINGTMDDFYQALCELPMQMRMKTSFSFPFCGSGACVCDINITNAAVMEYAKDNCYKGWPLIQRKMFPLDGCKEEEATVVSPKKKKNKIFPVDILYVTTEILLLAVLAVFTMKLGISTESNMLQVAIQFHPATLCSYLIVLAEGILIGMTMMNRKRKRGKKK